MADPMSEYYQRVAGEIKKAMAEKGYSQKDLARECQKRFNFNISQSTVSKIVHAEAGRSVSMAYVSAVCQALDLDLARVLAIVPRKAQGKAGAPAKADGDLTLVSDPAHRAFRGYIGKTYDIFFLSTASSANELVCGTMALSSEEDRFCKIHIMLQTNRLPPKEYFGRMLVSLQLRACYCMVESNALGEQCGFIFQHRFFSQDSLRVRLAVASTVSAGGEQRPTMHRMAICEQGVADDDEKRAFIAAQLLLNNSRIMISERNFNALRRDEALRELLQALEPRKYALEPYYIFEESDIMRLSGYDFLTLVKALARLREGSVSKRYNKIGGNADELLYRYLFPAGPA